MALSWIGEYGAVWLAIGLVAAFVTRRPRIILLVGGALLVAHLATAAIKDAVDRSRPPSRLPEIEPLVSVPSSAAFPSGHAATGFAAALVLAVSLPRHAPALVALAAAIAFSRLYVGVHFPSDVAAGAILGVLVATGLLLLARARPGSRP